MDYPAGGRGVPADWGGYPAVWLELPLVGPRGLCGTLGVEAAWAGRHERR